MQRLTGASSILICPVVTEDGGGGILSASHPAPKFWDEREVEFISEFAEVVHPFLGQARAQQALKQSEAIFRDFAENSDVVFWMADPDNQESIYVSPAYDEIWESPREELKTNPRAFLNTIVPEDRSMVMRSFLEHRKGPFEKFYRLKRPNGKIRWIKDRSFPVKNETGEIYRIVGFAEDITALREMQERLEISRAQAASNAKFAALGEMASGIAHEINNPLTVIQGLAQQLKESEKGGNWPSPELRDSLETIEKMSVRISSIVKGLRTFSRHTEEDPMASASLTAILQETVAICSPCLQAAGVRLSMSFPREDFILSCRPSEISQVLLNLLNNAKDAASSSAEKFIVVGVRSAGGKLSVEVEDSGPGVPEGIQEKIFQPFFTTKEVGAGTGLGLSISRSIVEAHGGRLFLDSSSRRTKFVVELPAETK
jgi:PAS domain S-box-containing protein